MKSRIWIGIVAFGAVASACASGSASSPSAPVDGGGVAADGASADGATTPQDARADATSGFAFTSAMFTDGGTLPAVYTCDGAGTSPPLAWSGVPAGTAELALLMTTEARDGRKWNWVLYGIPANANGLEPGASGVGKAGLTSDGPLLQYYPPCSQGPGAKSYTFTLHALSAKAVLPAVANQVTGAVLEAAIANLTIASRAITVSYTRP